MTPAARREALVRAVRSLGAVDGEAARANEAIQRDGALSAAMARWALQSSVARYTDEAVAALAHTADLEGRDVAVLLASSVASAPLRAIALPLLRGAARVHVRPSRRQPSFATLVVEAFVAAGLPVVCDTRSTAPDFLARVQSEGADTVIAYGADDTLRALERALPVEIALEAYGHGLGVSVVTRDVDLDAAADAVARDVAHYDQRGCLSPQGVFVEGTASESFAARLHAALARLERELPRGPLDALAAAEVHQWQGATAAIATEVHRGRAWSVATLEASVLRGSPGARNVAVAPVASLSALAAVLAPHAAHLTCVGIAGDLTRALSEAFGYGSAPRVVAAGTMQDPPLDGPEDPRAPFIRRPAR